MLKKLMLLLSCVSLIALVACGEENGPTVRELTPKEAELEPFAEFELSIEMISDEELEALEMDNAYTYINYGTARDLFITDGINLLFTFDQPVTDFSLIAVEALEDGRFVKTGVITEVGELTPDKPLVITQYFGNGTMPASGFYFVDSNGESGWFVFQQSQMDGEMHWWPFDWSHDYDLFIVEGYDEIDTYLFESEAADEDKVFEPDPITFSEVELSIIRMTPYETEDGLIDFQNTLHYYQSSYDLEFIQLLDYNELIQMRDGVTDLDDTTGDFLMIRTNVPLREFAVILMGHELLEDGTIIYIPIESFGMIEDFRPEDGFVIHSYLSQGRIPWSGVTFLDENGVRHYHAIMQNQSETHDLDPYFFQAFTNRTDELPPDWQPWW